MNYKILDPNLPFAFQVSERNAIFVIRDDFNLQKATACIGAGSILKFEGGSVTNGIIWSEDCHIEASLVKIFNGIEFQGNFLNGQIFEIEWFVKDYENQFLQYSGKDASKEINEAFSCGPKTIRFNNCRYYPIKNTIVVNGTVDIIGKTRYCDSPSWNFRQPCIYNITDLKTLFEYTYINTSNKAKARVNIEGMNFFYNTHTASNDSNNYESIVKIKRVKDKLETQQENPPTALWGMYINININALHNSEECPFSFINGLEVIASGASITFIEIHGYISMVYNAYKFWKESDDCYITDTKIFGNTRCVRGGDFYDGYPVRNYGSHQPIHHFDRNNQIAYFNAVQFENYGYVWDLDCNVSQKGKYTCRYLAKPIDKGFLYDGSQRKYSPVVIEVPSDFIYPNLLADNTIKYNSSFGSDSDFSIKSQTNIVCRNSNDEVIEYPGKTVEEQLEFKRYRFPKRITRWDSTYLYASKRSDIGYSWNGVPDFKYDYNVIIEIKRTNNVGWYQDRPPLYICPSDSRQDFSITVEYYYLDNKGEEIKNIYDRNNLVESFTFSRIDVNPYDYGKYIKIADIFYRVTQEKLSGVLFTRITYHQEITGLRLIPRPMFYIPNYHATDIVRGGTELVSLTPYDKGETYYHENYGMLIWNGESWREQDNAIAGVKRNGSFEERPSSNDIYVGYKYFCTGKIMVNGLTKSNIPIFFTGSSWVDSNGNTATSI